MTPAFITFTGVDRFTDLDRLSDLSERYPIEWGILLGREETARMPGPYFAERFPAMGVRCALHLCGVRAHQFQAEGALAWMTRYGRIQVNLSDAQYDTEALALAATSHPGRVIAQTRRTDFVPADTTFDWLYDPSGGRGALPGVYPKGDPRRIIGYAGGLGPETVAPALSRIAPAAGIGPYWIDMESHIRDADDRLDLDACEKVAAIVYGTP